MMIKEGCWVGGEPDKTGWLRQTPEPGLHELTKEWALWRFEGDFYRLYMCKRCHSPVYVPKEDWDE